jgi:hypothetical protein
VKVLFFFAFRYYQGMEGLCTGVGIHDGEFHLEIRAQEKELYPLQVGKAFGLELTERRACIGFRSPGSTSLEPCPDDIKGISANQCDACLERAQMLPCLRCTGERCMNPARRSDCVQPKNHAVYLASFGPGVLKVGVARWLRRNERVREQGSRAGIIIARDDGQLVRRIESQIKKYGIRDRIAPTEKLRALTQVAQQEQLIDELREELAMIKTRVRGAWLDQVETVALEEAPLLQSTPRLVQPESGLRIKGQITDIIGQILLVSADTGETVALEAPSLVGYQLRELALDEIGEGQLALSI